MLSAAAGRRGNRVRTNIPPSLRGQLLPAQGEVVEEFALMGWVIDPEAVVAALRPAWLARVRASGDLGGSFRISTGAGPAEVRADATGIRVQPEETQGAEVSLDERAFAHLLFRGFDAAAGERVGAVRDASLLRILFPEQDFVVWRADAF